MGSDFITKLCNEITNNFWIDVFRSWLEIWRIEQQKNMNIYKEHIWYNPRHIIGQTSVFLKSYFNAGFVFISDLFDSDKNFLSLDTFKRLDVKTNFIEYSGLKQAVIGNPLYRAQKNTTFSYGPFLPISMAIFYFNKKGCKDMYNVLINRKKETSTSILKWNENGYRFTASEWSKIFELPFKVTQESKLHWLQFQILHRLIPTNQYLHKLKLKTSPTCSFCKNDIESIEHLFIECPLVRKIWDDIEEWLLNKFRISVTFDKPSILFGKYKKKNMYKVHNLLSLIIKHYIFSCKYKKHPILSTNVLKVVIEQRILVEKFLLLKQCKFSEFNDNWQHICNML